MNNLLITKENKKNNKYDQIKKKGKSQNETYRKKY